MNDLLIVTKISQKLNKCLCGLGYIYKISKLYFFFTENKSKSQKMFNQNWKDNHAF